MEENTKLQSKEIDYLTSESGENEGSQTLEPKPCLIAGIVIQTKNKDDVKMDNPLVNVHVKHPDKDEPINLTAIKWLNGEKMVVSALFVSVDKEGKFFKDSAIAKLLSFNGVKTLKELEGKTIDTIKQNETSKYLAIKCYK